jgi:hypothetical protein
MPDPTPLRAESPSTALVAQPLVFKVELDERCVTFPDGKMLQHLLIAAAGRSRVTVDAVYAFNRTHQDPRLVSFSLEEARDFVKELINAVYTARSGFVLNDTLKITINVVANGYNIEVLRAEEKREILFSTAVIWRVIKAFLLAVDAASPVVTN